MKKGKKGTLLTYLGLRKTSRLFAARHNSPIRKRRKKAAKKK